MAKIECLAEHIHPLSLFILLALFICRPKSEVVNIECLAEHIHPLRLFIQLALFIRQPKSGAKLVWVEAGIIQFWIARLGGVFWGFWEEKGLWLITARFYFRAFGTNLYWPKLLQMHIAHCTLQSPPLHLCTLHRLESELSLTPSRFSCSVVHHICPRYLSLKLTNENTHKWISIHIEHSTSSVVVFMANFGKTLSGVHFPIEILKNPQRFSVVSFAIFCHFKFSKNRWWWW